MAAEINQNEIIYKDRVNPIQFFVSGASNLVNIAIYWAMGETATSTKLVEKTNQGATPTITVEGLLVTVWVTPSDLSSVTAGNYYHELKFVDLDTNPIQGSSGMMEVRETLIS